jgi:hypothetical protein
MSDPMAVSRRLVAVFAADVEGYSRLMGADEVGTLKGLTERRAILDRLIGEHGGRIANTAGDSVLAEFGSAVEAVECAVKAQAPLCENAREQRMRRNCFLPFPSFECDCQCCSFPIQRNRDKISARKFDVGLFHTGSVNNGPAALEIPLPFYPRDRTSPTRPAMSVWCQKRKSERPLYW